MLFFDSVLHVAACAAKLAVQSHHRPSLSVQRCDHKRWILSPVQILRFADHPPGARPAVSGPILELCIDLCGVAALPMELSSPFHLRVDGCAKPAVTGHSKQIVHTAVTPNDDPHLVWPHREAAVRDQPLRPGARSQRTVFLPLFDPPFSLGMPAPGSFHTKGPCRRTGRGSIGCW